MVFFPLYQSIIEAASIAIVGRFLVSTLIGVLSHVLLYSQGEWHMSAPTLLRAYTLIALGIYWTEYSYGSSTCFVNGSKVVVGYALGLFSSICVYRFALHRLRRFPGPPLAALSKFWHVYQCRDSKNFLVLENLRLRYGDFVRTGPTEITVFNPEILPAIDGHGTRCTKAVWYDLLLPEIALNTTRDKSAHDKRRRIWDHGFTTKAVAYYEERAKQYTRQLQDRITLCSRTNTPINVSMYFYWLTFDIMGEFAFAKSFDMLENERWHIAVVMLRKAMRLLGPLSPVPWVAQIGFNIVPWFWVVKDWLAMLQWCRDQMAERLRMTSCAPDVAHWLISASKQFDSSIKDIEWLNGDAVTIIIAGSDTVAPTLVYIFYELVKDPIRIKKLREELTGVDIHDKCALQRLPYLTGVINETLRLHPPVPTGGYRETPPEGITVAGVYIPGNTTIVAPRYSIGRLESAFERANEFIPERWSSRPEMLKDKRAFAPFAQGRYNCVGKSLAMSELRLVTAVLVQKFDFRLAPGECGEDVIKNMRDQFTAAPGNLWLSFTERVGVVL